MLQFYTTPCLKNKIHQGEFIKCRFSLHYAFNSDNYSNLEDSMLLRQGYYFKHVIFKMNSISQELACKKLEYYRGVHQLLKTHLRMYCIDTEALVFMFNGGSPYSFTIHPIFTRILMI